VGGTSILFLLIGIHNAWDTVTYLAFHRLPREKAKLAGEKHAP
jgi:hypothetical protein